MGGNAELELVDSLNPFSDGISFTVRPPKRAGKALVIYLVGKKLFPAFRSYLLYIT